MQGIALLARKAKRAACPGLMQDTCLFRGPMKAATLGLGGVSDCTEDIETKRWNITRIVEQSPPHLVFLMPSLG